MSRSAIDITHTRAHRARENTTGLDCADLWTCLRVGARSMRMGGMQARARYRYHSHAGTQGAREQYWTGLCFATGVTDGSRQFE